MDYQVNANVVHQKDSRAISSNNISRDQKINLTDNCPISTIQRQLINAIQAKNNPFPIQRRLKIGGDILTKDGITEDMGDAECRRILGLAIDHPLTFKISNIGEIDRLTNEFELLQNVSDKKYAFTHETTNSYFQTITDNQMLIAGSLIGTSKAARNDIRKSGNINPVYTRVMPVEAETVTNHKKIDRLAFNSEIVGGDQPILLLIAPRAVDADHSAVGGKITSTPTDKEYGYRASYNGDQCKGGTNTMSPEMLASGGGLIRVPGFGKRKQDYKYNNEQHWHGGINLKNQVVAIVIKVQHNGKTTDKNSLIFADNRLPKAKTEMQYTYDELIAKGNPDVRAAATNAIKLTPLVIGVPGNYKLNTLMKELKPSK